MPECRPGVVPGCPCEGASDEEGKRNCDVWNTLLDSGAVGRAKSLPASESPYAISWLRFGHRPHMSVTVFETVSRLDAVLLSKG